MDTISTGQYNQLDGNRIETEDETNEENIGCLKSMRNKLLSCSSIGSWCNKSTFSSNDPCITVLNSKTYTHEADTPEWTGSMIYIKLNTSKAFDVAEIVNLFTFLGYYLEDQTYQDIYRKHYQIPEEVENHESVQYLTHDDDKSADDVINLNYHKSIIKTLKDTYHLERNDSLMTTFVDEYVYDFVTYLFLIPMTHIFSFNYLYDKSYIKWGKNPSFEEFTEQWQDLEDKYKNKSLELFYHMKKLAEMKYLKMMLYIVKGLSDEDKGKFFNFIYSFPELLEDLRNDYYYPSWLKWDYFFPELIAEILNVSESKVSVFNHCYNGYLNDNGNLASYLHDTGFTQQVEKEFRLWPIKDLKLIQILDILEYADLKIYQNEAIHALSQYLYIYSGAGNFNYFINIFFGTLEIISMVNIYMTYLKIIEFSIDSINTSLYTIMFVNIIFLTIEVIQRMTKLKLIKKLSIDVWDSIDMIHFIYGLYFSLIMLFYHTQEDFYADNAYTERTLIAWYVITGGCHLMKFARNIPFLDTYVQLVVQSVLDSLVFLFVMLMFTLACGIGFSAMYFKEFDVEESGLEFSDAILGDDIGQYSSFLTMLYSAYKMTFLGDFDFNNFENTVSAWNCLAMFVIATLIVIIVGLNSLIAILGETYSKHRETEKENLTKLMLGNVVEWETTKVGILKIINFLLCCWVFDFCNCKIGFEENRELINDFYIAINPYKSMQENNMEQEN